MKTLHLVNAWRLQGGGGITTFYNTLLEQARATGESMVLVAPGERDTVIRQGSTAIYTVQSPVTPFNDHYRMIVPDSWPGINRRVLDILRAEKPGLVDVCDKYSLHYVAGLLRRGWLHGVPRPVLVATSCERMDENMAHYLSKGVAARAFCRWYLKWNYFGFFDHHITVSAHTAGELREAAKGHVRKRGVWVMPMGVDCSRFSPDLRNPHSRHHWLLRADGSENTRLLVYAGRLVPEKNLPLLIDAVEHLVRRGSGDYRLILAGDGMERHRLERECRERLPGDVIFVGHLGPGQLPSLLANADAFVHPNAREPFGIAPLEAMASGLPLAACRGGGIESYANTGNAWLAGTPEPALLAAAIESIFEGPATARIRKVATALETARSLNWPEVASRFRRLYSDFVRGEATGAAFESTRGNWLGSEASPFAPR